MAFPKDARVASATGFLAVFCGTFASALLPTSTQTAVANGDTRTIHLYHAHTKESIDATYRVNGQYDPAVLQKLNWFLRDWRRDEPTNMDPRLFDTVWEVYRIAGASEPITVVSAYRSPETNSMLRRRSRAVAKYSQHMLGKAMDTAMPGMSMERVREIGMRLQRGGVGYYPTAGTPFVHLDVGSVRHWPRMNYDQLARLFPDGKTVHLPSNNQPLARYEEARAEIEANGGTAYGAPVARKSAGLFAWLFGGGSNTVEEDEEETAPAAPARGRRGRTQVAAAAPRDMTSSIGEDGGRNLSGVDRGRPDPISRAERNLPRGETIMQQGPAEAMASRDKSGSESKDAFGTLLPMPPKRPTDLTGETTVAANVPLPPSRPVALLAALEPTEKTPGEKAKIATLAKADVLGEFIGTKGLDSSKPTGATAVPPQPQARPANLPVIITEGLQMPKHGTPPASQAVAYAAAPARLSGLRPAALNKAAPAPEPPIRTVTTRAALIPVQLDRSSLRDMTTGTTVAEMKTSAPTGGAVAGLRQAARTQPGALSDKPCAGYVTAFGRIASDLNTASFSGSAVQALTMRAASVRVAEDR